MFDELKLLDKLEQRILDDLANLGDLQSNSDITPSVIVGLLFAYRAICLVEHRKAQKTEAENREMKALLERTQETLGEIEKQGFKEGNYTNLIHNARAAIVNWQAAQKERGGSDERTGCL